jgi:hypothetical protein
LKAKSDTGEKIGILDLLRFEEDPQGVLGIPGAIRLDPLELRRKEQSTFQATSRSSSTAAAKTASQAPASALPCASTESKECKYWQAASNHGKPAASL